MGEKMENKNKLSFALGALSNVMKRFMLKNYKDKSCGLTNKQMMVISFVKIESRKRDVFQKDIEEHLLVRGSTATELLQLMEKNGYITRSASAFDARLKKIELTEKSEMIFSNAKKYLDEFEKVVCKDIDENDLQVFFKVVNQISSNLGGQQIIKLNEKEVK